MFCKACFVNLTEVERQNFKVKKLEAQRKRKEEAAMNRAKRSLKKILNDRKLQKIETTTTAKSDPDNLLLHNDQ